MAIKVHISSTACLLDLKFIYVFSNDVKICNFQDIITLLQDNENMLLFEQKLCDGYPSNFVSASYSQPP